MNTTSRIQLTLFINEAASAAIEQVRRVYNPVQYSIIKSHVTLCREDELSERAKVINALEGLNQKPITMRIGCPERYAKGKGLLLPVEDDAHEFLGLRKKVLQNVTGNTRMHHAHITLIHPRNGACTDEIFEMVSQLRFPDLLTFGKISLIEQVGAGEWRILRSFLLTG